MPATTSSLPKLHATVRVFHDIKGRAEILGFADLVIGDAFVIKDIRIILAKTEKGPSEPFVSFPSKKGSGTAQEKYFDIAHPITTEAYQTAKDLILRAYDEAAAKSE